MRSFERFNAANKLINIESAIDSETGKGDDMNREFLTDLAKQKKDLKAVIDSLPVDAVISREDVLYQCNLLLKKLEDALSVDVGNDEYIDKLIKEVSSVQKYLLL